MRALADTPNVDTAPEGGGPLAPQVDLRLTGSDEVGARPELTL